MKKRIRIDVSPDGNIKAETLGIYGSKCMDYVGILEDILDAQAVESSFTEDYSRVEEVVTGEQGVQNES